MQRDAPRSPIRTETAKVLGLGLGWALSTLLFLWLGSVCDRWLGTAPWLTLIGAFVGGAAGLYSMIHNLGTGPRRRAGRDDDDERGQEERSGRERG